MRPLPTSVEIGGRIPFRLALPSVMAIVNTTPDSFSDGGDFADASSAVRAASEALDAGAQIVDIGGESTRPGARLVEASEELARVLPVIRAVREARPHAILSIDTLKSAVARAAVDAGAAMVNDVSGLDGDAAMAETVAELDVPIVIGHRRGDAATMQSLANYRDVACEVRDELAARCERALAAGIPRDRILIDPGLGFAKRADHNWELLARLPELIALGYPVVVGASRKSFLGELLGGRPPKERDDASLACAVLAAAAGASIVRVHRAAPAVDALAVVERLRRTPQNPHP